MMNGNEVELLPLLLLALLIDSPSPVVMEANADVVVGIVVVVVVVGTSCNINGSRKIESNNERVSPPSHLTVNLIWYECRVGAGVAATVG